MTLGEEICGNYLQFILGCDFVKYNVRTGNKQEEIDVIGIKLAEKKLFVCEVATHTSGFSYGSGGQNDVDNKISKKFNACINYIDNEFLEFDYELMLWTPKLTTKVNTSIRGQLNKAVKSIESRKGKIVKIICNEEYAQKLVELKEYARNQSHNHDSTIMRIYQIEKSCGL